MAITKIQVNERLRRRAVSKKCYHRKVYIYIYIYIDIYRYRYRYIFRIKIGATLKPITLLQNIIMIPF